jgi:copper homeostasis protein
MPTSFLLEIAVQSIETARAAERGGADRIELCAQLDCGGTTPSVELQREVRMAVQIPIHVLIRPRDGNFVHSNDEMESMKRQIESTKANGVNGVVLGVLNMNQSIDIQRTRELVSHANPLPVTFHRAFDETPDILQALAEVCSTGAARILTSGGAKDAVAGSARLRELVETARGRIIVMPGGGIRAENIAGVLRATGAREFHSGLGTVMDYNAQDVSKFESEVRKLRQTCVAAAFCLP